MIYYANERNQLNVLNGNINEIIQSIDALEYKKNIIKQKKAEVINRIILSSKEEFLKNKDGLFVIACKYKNKKDDNIININESSYRLYSNEIAFRLNKSRWNSTSFEKIKKDDILSNLIRENFLDVIIEENIKFKKFIYEFNEFYKNDKKNLKYQYLNS